MNTMSKLKTLINDLENEHEIDKDGLIKLLICSDPASIYAAANRARKNLWVIMSI